MSNRGSWRRFRNNTRPATTSCWAPRDIYPLMAAFDSEWNAAVPYSMLIRPDGTVVYQRQGALDPLEVRRLIIANLADDDYIGHQAYCGLFPKSRSQRGSLDRVDCSPSSCRFSIVARTRGMQCNYEGPINRTHGCQRAAHYPDVGRLQS